MGPNEIAIAIPGGPLVIDVFDVSGCCRAQIKHFFGMQIGSWTPHGLGLMVSVRLHRLRMRFGHPIALKAPDQNHLQIIPDSAGLLRELAYMIRAPVYAV